MINPEYHYNPTNIIKEEWKENKFPFLVTVSYENGEIITFMESILTGHFEEIQKAIIDNLEQQ